MAEIIKINSHTWRFEDDFVRYFLLEGEEKAVMIDSGVNSPNALELAKTLTDKPIMLMNTHGDGDHISGTNAFSKIHMHVLDYENYKIGSRYPNADLEPVDDGDVIDLGNRLIKAIFIPGHTKGSLAFLDIDERVLLAGDTVQKAHIYMFGPNRDLEQYEGSLEKLIAMSGEYDKIYASHDEFCLSKDYAQKVKEAWRQVKSGEVSFEEIELFGNKIKSYTTDVCGFYME